MDYPNLRAEVLTGVVTGIKVSEDYPLTQMFGGLTVDVDGDIAKWDQVTPIRTIDKTFEARDDVATPTNPQTVQPKAQAMVHNFKKRYVYPEHLDALRVVGGASADRDRSLSNLGWMLGDMKRRYHDEPHEYLIAAALQDNVSITIKGVTVTPDFGLAAGHNLTAGASWATVGTDIDADMETIKRLSVTDSGRQAKVVLCGRNIFGYLRKNTAIKSWLQNYVGAESRFAALQSDRIDNLFGLTWLTMRHGYFVGSTFTPYIPDDVIVVIPDPAKDWFQVHRGSVRYPNTVYGPPTAFEKSYGLTSWSRLHDEPPSACVYMRWAALPVPVFPDAVVVMDVTP